MHRILICVVASMVCASVSAQSSISTSSRQKAARQVATRVRQIAPDAREVFVRPFRGMGQNDAGLAKLIGDELRERGVRVSRGAPVEVEGRLFRLPVDESQPLTGFTIRPVVILANGRERRFSIDVKNRDEAHITVGQSQEVLPPPGSRRPAETSGLDVQGSVVRPAKDSPYGVEMLVERGGRLESLSPSVRNGLVHVQVRKGDRLAVKLINDSGQSDNSSAAHRAAVDVLIDGVSRFALADAAADRSARDIVSAGRPRVIRGYYRNGSEVEAFRVGDYDTSVAAAQLAEESDAGTITVAFRAAWERGAPRPDHEPPPHRGRRAGINRGKRLKDETQTVNLNTGVVRAVVRVAYAVDP